jgi:hypothetical protein
MRCWLRPWSHTRNRGDPNGNDQFRICFRRTLAGPEDVEVVDCPMKGHCRDGVLAAGARP